MGAAADLLAETAHGVHLDLLAILAFKQADGALVLGLGDGHLAAGDGGFGLDGFVNELLDLGDFLFGHLAAEGKVET